MAIIEEAYKTQETILNISELVRYIYDSRKQVITLDEEFSAVLKYIEVQNLKAGRDITYTAENLVTGEQAYIRHLSVLGHLVQDIEKNLEEIEEGSSIKYVLEAEDEFIVLKKSADSKVLENISIPRE